MCRNKHVHHAQCILQFIFIHLADNFLQRDLQYTVTEQIKFMTKAQGIQTHSFPISTVLLQTLRYFLTDPVLDNLDPDLYLFLCLSVKCLCHEYIALYV